MIVKTVCFRDYEPIGGKQQVERIDIEQKLLYNKSSMADVVQQKMVVSVKMP